MGKLLSLFILLFLSALGAAQAQKSKLHYSGKYFVSDTIINIEGGSSYVADKKHTIAIHLETTEIKSMVSGEVELSASNNSQIYFPIASFSLSDMQNPSRSSPLEVAQEFDWTPVVRAHLHYKVTWTGVGDMSVVLTAKLLERPTSNK